jgi:dUTP pyrophosphatase
MNEREITIELLAEEEVSAPHYASEGASGADVRAHIVEEIVLQPGASALVPTGLKLAIPEGYEVQVRPRSGLALKHQVTVLNTPGTIDSDFRGEIKVIIINHGKESFVIQPGMRIAQFVVCPVIRAQFTRRSDLLPTSRGAGGFGHTGLD